MSSGRPSDSRGKSPLLLSTATLNPMGWQLTIRLRVVSTEGIAGTLEGKSRRVYLPPYFQRLPLCADKRRSTGYGAGLGLVCSYVF